MENRVPVEIYNCINRFNSLVDIGFYCDFELENSNLPSQNEKITFVFLINDLEAKKIKKIDNGIFLRVETSNEIQKTISTIYEVLFYYFAEKFFTLMAEYSLKDAVEEESNENELFQKWEELLAPVLLTKKTTSELVNFFIRSQKELGIIDVCTSCELEELAEFSRMLYSLESSLLVKEQCELQTLIIPNRELKSFFKIKLSQIHSVSIKSFSTLLKVLECTQKIETSRKEAFFFEEFPMAIVLNAEDLFYSSHAFMEMQFTVSDISKFRDGQIIHSSSKDFNIIKFNYENDKDLNANEGHLKQEQVTIVVLVPLELQGQDLLKKAPEEELGIICSSIAHELNNPIGGVLNAFQLIELMEEGLESSSVIFAEAEKSMKRAHKLVNLFLGFVKTNFKENNSNSIRVCYTNAIDLLRGRMVRENCFLAESEYQESDGDKKSFNESMLTIVFYVLLSDSLTYFARSTLIRNTDRFEKSFLFTVVEHEKELSFTFENFEDIASQIKPSSFLKYLLKTLNLSLEVVAKGFIFKWS